MSRKKGKIVNAEVIECEPPPPEIKKLVDEITWNYACRLCLEDVLQWLETGKVDGVGFDDEQVIDVVKCTLEGKYPPESFQSGDEPEKPVKCKRAPKRYV